MTNQIYINVLENVKLRDSRSIFERVAIPKSHSYSTESNKSYNDYLVKLLDMGFLEVEREIERDHQPHKLLKISEKGLEYLANNGTKRR